jgi:hypothetical protein
MIGGPDSCPTLRCFPRFGNDDQTGLPPNVHLTCGTKSGEKSVDGTKEFAEHKYLGSKRLQITSSTGNTAFLRGAFYLTPLAEAMLCE